MSILWDSIYIKYKNWQQHPSMVIENTSCYEAWGLIGRGYEGISWGDENVLYLIGVWVTWVNIRLKTHQIVFLRYIRFTIWKIFPKKIKILCQVPGIQ